MEWKERAPYRRKGQSKEKSLSGGSRKHERLSGREVSLEGPEKLLFHFMPGQS